LALATEPEPAVTPGGTGAQPAGQTAAMDAALKRKKRRCPKLAFGGARRPPGWRTAARLWNAVLLPDVSALAP
jgi:hypothetical protein